MNSKESLRIYIIEKFGELNESVQKAMDVAVQMPSDFSPTAYAVIEQIFSVTLATSYVLLALFFIIDLCNKTMMFETSNYIVIVKLLLRFLLAKIIVDSSKHIMLIIFNSFSKILLSITTTSSPLGEIVKNKLLEKVDTMDGGFLGIGYIGYYLELQPSMLVIWIASLIAGVIVIGRMFEIMIYTAIAPLPLSTLAGETSSDTAKKFIQNYVAICLQGVIIILCFKLFTGVMADYYTGSNIGLISYITMILVFIYTLTKSGSWSKQIVGAG